MNAKQMKVKGFMRKMRDMNDSSSEARQKEAMRFVQSLSERGININQDIQNRSELLGELKQARK